MTISTTVFLYSLSILAGTILVVYGLSMKPGKEEQHAGARDISSSSHLTLPIDADFTLLPEDDSSEKQAT